MKVLNLKCARAHSFEGWFASEDDYQSQMARGLVSCPLCADTSITKLPSAPRLNVSKAGERSVPEAGGVTQAVAPQTVTTSTMWLRAVQEVLANTVDVGERFAEEARRIHYGETEERAIRGQATREDAAALQEEGIEVMALPMPSAIKGPVQ